MLFPLMSEGDTGGANPLPAAAGMLNFLIGPVCLRGAVGSVAHHLLDGGQQDAIGRGRRPEGRREAGL